MAINIDFLSKMYFAFDDPVPYEVNNNKTIYIKPIKLRDSEFFLGSVGVLSVDKNSVPDPNIISMSYLTFLIEVLCKEQINIDRLVIILKYCLGFEHLDVYVTEKNRYLLVDKKLDIEINHKQFEDIRRIILYQNILHYDDEYINPELKQKMDETDALRNKSIEAPSLERKISIITAHCGLSKREQLEMTLRAHTSLYEEVCGEVEFAAVYPIAVFAGKANTMDHWLRKKKKGRLDGYATSVDEFAKSAGLK